LYYKTYKPNLNAMAAEMAKQTNNKNKMPMGHIAHLRNTGSYENTFRILIYISFPFAPPDPQEP
jgi:hypothetical protein